MPRGRQPVEPAGDRMAGVGEGEPGGAAAGQARVAVAYSGCSMRVLPRVPRARASYHWQRTTPASESLEINDSDELYAKLPLGAASLEGELKRSGKLAVRR